MPRRYRTRNGQPLTESPMSHPLPGVATCMHCWCMLPYDICCLDVVAQVVYLPIEFSNYTDCCYCPCHMHTCHDDFGCVVIGDVPNDKNPPPRPPEPKALRRSQHTGKEGHKTKKPTPPMPPVPTVAPPKPPKPRARLIKRKAKAPPNPRSSKMSESSPNQESRRPGPAPPRPPTPTPNGTMRRGTQAQGNRQGNDQGNSQNNSQGNSQGNGQGSGQENVQGSGQANEQGDGQGTNGRESGQGQGRGDQQNNIQESSLEVRNPHRAAEQRNANEGQAQQPATEGCTGPQQPSGQQNAQSPDKEPIDVATMSEMTLVRIHLLERGFRPWLEQNSGEEFTFVRAWIRPDIKLRELMAELFEDQDFQRGDPTLIECVEVAGGGWTQGAIWRHSSRRSKKTAAKAGWTAVRGPEGPPVWLAWGTGNA